MKKVIGGIAGLFFGVFCVGVIGLLISLTYGALQRLFPGNFTNQLWGLVLYDIATIAWAFAFVFKSKSAGQYVAAGAGFITGFVGTIGMVAAEVTLSSANLTGGQIDTSQIGQWMVYAFIVVTIIHVALIYAHHGADPDIAIQISTGIARGEVRDHAMKDAVKQLDVEKASLARAITLDIVSQVKRDLQLTPVDGTPFDRRQEPRTYQAETPSPQINDLDTSPVSDDVKRMYAPGTHFRDGTITPEDLNDPFWSEHPHHMGERYETKPQAEPEAGDQPSPFLKSQPEQ